MTEFHQAAAMGDGPLPAQTIMARLDRLAEISSERPALTRLFLSPEHKAASALVQSWMEQAGMSAGIDAIGNVVGRYQAVQPDAKTLIIGSHIDTVRDAGRYDGNLGVVVAIGAVAELARRGERLPFAIEVIAFGDEEGVRFPEALSSSRAVAGIFNPAALDAADKDGVPLRQALRDFGCDPDAVAALGRRKGETVGYLEVHIEQGPVLEAEGLPVGVVTAIAGASRLRATVKGVAGHAGTVPMHLRQDAFAATAEIASAIERLALETPDLVATVGRVEVLPGAVNVIPAEVRFTIDIRSPKDAIRDEALTRLGDMTRAIAARRGVTCETEVFYQEPAAPCARLMRGALERSIRRLGLRVLALPSGAGHDGLAMTHLCPIGMLFVRCAGGISHNPAESITDADADVAFQVLLGALRDLGSSSPT